MNYIKIIRRLSKASACKLDLLPLVRIDDGIFKYVLIKVNEKQSDAYKLVVCGTKNEKWHSDIYKAFRETIEKAGLETQCLGGGKIEHRPEEKYIKIYGYSQGFGRADHTETRRILQNKYKDYDIEISDQGY